MQAFSEFQNMSADFWAFIKFISEMLGYTHLRSKTVRSYTFEEIQQLCYDKNTAVSPDYIQKAVRYCDKRAELLNNYVRNVLMDAETARMEFSNLFLLHQQNHFRCKLPLNKQKGDMKQVAYFTAIINILAEKTIKEHYPHLDWLGFDDDPRGLVYVWDDKRHIIGASSRRFDGAIPSIESPVMVWEIKEYYYATTFGSRIADGVYETQLDGFEFQELYDRTGKKIYHVLFIDAYRTWWEQGKSYLCRIVDALNCGLVDEVIFGGEVFSRWPALLHSALEQQPYFSPK